ncbi:hypothetical protein E2C01_035025 [Portunus trituberculatus]|uniref:Uncharacterized protein n=1 Tax=Portunus trituberculatus TaxID=210409 RepID=A0A5B7FAC8_PORTR|nr:hypothetical protein [Portunus trituberculatus]
MLVLAMLAVTTVLAVAGQPTVKVMLNQGSITGSLEQALNDYQYYSFNTSILYALPPVGPLRFKAHSALIRALSSFRTHSGSSLSARLSVASLNRTLIFITSNQ